MFALRAAGRQGRAAARTRATASSPPALGKPCILQQRRPSPSCVLWHRRQAHQTVQQCRQQLHCCALRACCQDRGNHRLGHARIQVLIPELDGARTFAQLADSAVSGCMAWEDGGVSRWMRRRWQRGWARGGPAQGCSPTCSSTALPCLMRPASTAARVRPLYSNQ